jgi:transposase
MADGHGKTSDFALAPRQAHELPLAPAMLDNHPAIPLWVVADKGYASNAFRERIWDMGTRSAIPAKRRDGLVACPKWTYRCRHLVENLWARFKEWRAVATRYEKTATSFLAVIHIAATADWIKP